MSELPKRDYHMSGYFEEVCLGDAEGWEEVCFQQEGPWKHGHEELAVFRHPTHGTVGITLYVHPHEGVTAFEGPFPVEEVTKTVTAWKEKK